MAKLITCADCGELKSANTDTRHDTCQSCWDAAGLENEHSDSGHNVFIPACPTCRVARTVGFAVDPIAAAMALEITKLETSPAMVVHATACARYDDAVAAMERAQAARTRAHRALADAASEVAADNDRLTKLRASRKVLVG